MNNNNTISWHYAQNFDENEKRWEEVKSLMIAKMRVITKSPLLAMTMIDECEECGKMIRAIEAGDRSEFLFDKAKEAVENAASLEEAGEIFTKAFITVLSQQNKQ